MRSDLFNLTVALQEDPDNPGLLYKVGALHGNNRNYAQAEFYLGRALEINPGDYMAKLDLATCFDNQGKRKQAETCYRELIAQNPQAWPAHFHLGACLANQNRDSEAIKFYQQALELEPSCYTAMYYLALTYKDVGDSASALNYAQIFSNFARENEDILPGLLIEAEKLMDEVVRPKPPGDDLALTA